MRAPATTSNIPRLRKVVRFPSEGCLAKVVAEVELPFTAEEKSSIWYQCEDYEEIHSEIQATILELMQIEEDMRYWDPSK